MTHFNAYGPIVLSAILTAAGLLAGCAATGTNDTSAKPVLYPNVILSQVGDTQIRAESDAGLARAFQAGLTADQKNSEVGRCAGKGAATAGVASVVGALTTGRSADVQRAGATSAAGAAIGGSAGAVSEAFHNDKADPGYRQFVQHCLSEKGFAVFGWN